MKYFINTNFKALRKGDYVTADESNGEFIYDSESCDFPQATLKEIAKANKIKISSKDNSKQICEKLDEGLAKLKIPKVDKMTDTQKVEEIIEAGVAAEKTDDEMLVEIVQAGISFKSAGKLFNNVMTEKGYRIAAKERSAKAVTILDDLGFSPKNYDDVSKAIGALTRGIPDTNHKQAISLIRKYAKTNGIELPKKEKAPGGFRAKFLDAMSKNALLWSDDDVKNWLDDQGKDDPEKIFNQQKMVIDAIRQAAVIGQESVKAA